MRVRFFEFDGTSEEFLAAGLGRAVSGNGRYGIPGTEDESVKESEADPNLVEQLAGDIDFLRQVLEKRPLTASQDQLLRLLLAAEPARWVSRSEMGAALNLTQDQLDGVFGWLGRRVNEVPRADMVTQLHIGVLFVWQRQGHEWAYRLRPTFRELLESFFAER